MKKITLILITLFAFIYANAQYTVPRGLPYHDTRWIENKGVAGATYLFDSIVMFRNIADTQMKPLYPAMGYIQNFAGDSTLWIWDMIRWKKLGGGATGQRFGIEDNLGIQDRNVDMQHFGFELYGASHTDMVSEGSGNFAFQSTSVSGDVFSLLHTDSAGVGGSALELRPSQLKYVLSVLGDDDRVEIFPKPLTAGVYYIPLSVNGNFADVTGAITIPIGGSGTVTSFSAGNLSPLFTSSVATSTTTPALTFSLTNAAGGTVFGNRTGSSAAPAYTAVPLLGVAGTTAGTIGLSGVTSGVVTIATADAAGTWTLKLPTTGGTNNYVLTTNGSGVSTWTDPSTLPSAAPTLTSTQIAFGDVSNLMTSSSNLIYDAGAETIFNNGIAATSTHALNLYNTTAATLGVPVQKSGMIEFEGSRFAGGVLSNSFWDIENIPSAGSPGNLTFAHATTSTGTNKFAILTIQGGNSSSGTVIVNSVLTATSQVTTGTISSTGIGTTLDVQGARFFTGAGDIQLFTPSHVSADNGYKLWVKGDALMNGLNIAQLTTPTITSVTQFSGASGSTTYKYKVVAVLKNGQTTDASPEVTYSSGNASLSVGSNLVTIGYVDGATQYKVYRTFSGGLPASTGLIATIAQTTSASAPLSVDAGAAGDGTTPPTINTTGNIIIAVNNFIDNAAAVAAGLPVGTPYRNGDVLQIVH